MTSLAPYNTPTGPCRSGRMKFRLEVGADKAPILMLQYGFHMKPTEIGHPI